MANVTKSSRPSNLLSIKESQARRDRPLTGIGIWRLGFRPFYLGAALFGSIAIAYWTLLLYGSPIVVSPMLANPVFWHAHEMVFGFALAVIAGFLLTASNNWTGILPAGGLRLAFIFTLWCVARFSFFTGHLSLAASTDILFAAILVVLLLRVLFIAKQWKNFTVIGMVALMGALNAWFYAILILDLPTNQLYPIELALLIILQLLVVMGGRVIPMFTQNGVPGISVYKPHFFVILVPITSALGIISWLFLPPRLACFACFSAAGINLIRWIGWKPWRCLRYPMVWVLQLGYLWIPITYVSFGLNSLGFTARSLPIHALAVGALSLIIFGMITRTAMGHTGRQIIPSRVELGMFSLIALSGLFRFFAATSNLLSTEIVSILLISSGVLWSIAAALYLFKYTSWLFRPRIDGRPG